MIFSTTPLDGAYVIRPEPIEDERGFFARVCCAQEFAENGLASNWVQCNIAYNHKRGIVRGLHRQIDPHAEVKLVRCTMGRLFDVIVDLRHGSPGRGQWFGIELSAANRKILYVPEGFAHGYQTLEDNTEVFYQVSAAHHPDAERGLRWDDPAIGIAWPIADSEVSERDRAWPSVTEAAC